MIRSGFVNRLQFSRDSLLLLTIAILVGIPSFSRKASAQDSGWFAFAPPGDPYSANNPIDLRPLNEAHAGDGGFIGVKGSQFVHSRTGEPVRFWAVNGPPGELKDQKSLDACAKMLAKHGVNLVRVHGGYFDERGKVDPAKVRHAQEIVRAMKDAGIYVHFSIYFPLWMTPKPDDPVLKGYDGKHHPFATLFFDPDFQKEYQSWWTALLTTPDPQTGKKLIDDPAAMSAEIINEDSYLFWTFTPANIPDPELHILEKQFGDWAAHKYGSIDAAYAHWNGLKTDRDAPARGRLGFRPLWNIANQKTPRDQDTATFLTEGQRDFYQKQYAFLRKLGFKGLITASNWITASPQVLTPLEKYSYTVCDFIDRHGYFSCDDKGPNDGWAIMNSQTYFDRSALRFDGEQPGKPKEFVNPVMDIHYDDKPSMISETTFNRPNRYRTEAPLYYACYGALQGSDCIVHFALDGAQWSVKPGYFMQPWTLMTPTQMAQFPAAALIYRKGLVDEGAVLADLNLKISDLEHLAGTPLPQDASFDELRLKDVPKEGQNLRPGNVVDPLIHYAGRTSVKFSKDGGQFKLADLSKLIDRAAKKVTSSTGQLRLDYGNGLLTINAPEAQGLCGNLKAAGAASLADLSIQSNLDLGSIIAVSLDGKPLASSNRILLSVMSEERPTGFATQPEGKLLKILNIGHDPWQIKDISGSMGFKRSDAAQLHVTALDGNGDKVRELGAASQIKLESNVIYYLISK